MTYAFLNECEFRARNGGLGDFVVDSATTGWFTPAQCTNPAFVDGALYAWRAESESLQQHELFLGAYDAATETVARTIILQSSNGGNKVDFNAAPRVRQVLITQHAKPIDPASAAFESTGANQPWYGTAVFPHAIYVSSTNVTWVTWEGWEPVTADRAVYVTTYNHATGVWTPAVVVGTGGLVDDDHGNPAIARDADGYVHIFGACHSSAMRNWVSNAPDDPSAWTELATIGTSLTYPKPMLIGSTLYLFARSAGTDAASAFVLYKSTAITNGVVTWAAPITLFELGLNTRVDAGNFEISGDNIYFAFTVPNTADSERFDAYVFLYNTATLNISNIDGSHTVAPGSFPIGYVDAYTWFLVAAARTTYTIPDICFDNAGNLHLLFTHLLFPDNLEQLYHIMWDGTSWSSPRFISQLDNDDNLFFLGFAPIAQPTGGIRIFNGYQPDLYTITRTDGAIAASTLEPHSIGPSTTISNGNRTVTSTGGASDQGARTIGCKSSGKFYCEVTINHTGAAEGTGVGVGNIIAAEFTVVGTDFLGSDTNGTGYYNSGNVYQSGAVATTLASFTSGDVVSIACDVTNKKVWFRVNGGNWNNSGAANPVTGAGGISISSTIGPIFAWLDLEASTNSVTINCGTAAYSFSVPSGFGNLVDGGGTWTDFLPMQLCGRTSSALQIGNPSRVFGGQPDFSAIWTEVFFPADGAATVSGFLRGWAWGENGYVAPSFSGDLSVFTRRYQILGNYATSNYELIYDPGGSVQTTYVMPFNIGISDYITGDLNALSPLGQISPIAAWNAYKHTGSSRFGNLQVCDIETVINDDSTGDFNFYIGGHFAPANYGSGDITNFFGFNAEPINYSDTVTMTSMYGIRAISLNNGATNGIVTLGGVWAIADNEVAATITSMIGVNAQCKNNGNGTITNAVTMQALTPTKGAGGSITNVYGLYIADHSGIGGTVSENIHSLGTNSLNVFEGSIDIVEKTAPSGVANRARLFARDNGSGKTQLAVIFGSGAVQVIATEP